MTTRGRLLVAIVSLVVAGCAEGLEAPEAVPPPPIGQPTSTCPTPGAATCFEGRATLCNDRGEIVEWECDPVQGMVCEPGGCSGACSPLSLGPSTMGCDYHPTVTPNPVWSGFEFAVVVGNTKDGPADVTITRGDEIVATRSIPADSDENYANLIAPVGTSVVLDGETIPASAFEPIGASGKAVHRKKLDPALVHSTTRATWSPGGSI